jgi:hypothetical protein
LLAYGSQLSAVVNDTVTTTPGATLQRTTPKAPIYWDDVGAQNKTPSLATQAAAQSALPSRRTLTPGVITLVASSELTP